MTYHLLIDDHSTSITKQSLNRSRAIQAAIQSKLEERYFGLSQALSLYSHCADPKSSTISSAHLHPVSNQVMAFACHDGAEAFTSSLT
jgi:hypothetical protein